MRFRAQQVGIKQPLRVGAIALMEDDARMLRLDLHPIDRMDPAVDPAERQIVGEPDGARAQAGADFEHRSRTQLLDQRRVDGEIEHGFHQRRAAPTHQRRSALAGQQHIDAKLGAVARMIMSGRPLAFGELDKPALLPAIKKQPESLQIPLQALALSGRP